MIAQLLKDGYSTDPDEIKGILGSSFERAFPVEVIAGIRIPLTHQEAISGRHAN